MTELGSGKACMRWETLNGLCDVTGSYSDVAVLENVCRQALVYLTRGAVCFRPTPEQGVMCCLSFGVSVSISDSWLPLLRQS